MLGYVIAVAVGLTIKWLLDWTLGEIIANMIWMMICLMGFALTGDLFLFCATFCYADAMARAIP